jgi:uncharacterized membrane protein (DUF2068 family)
MRVDRTSGIRVIAALEAAKGLAILVAGLGLLRFVHQDLEDIAEALVRLLHLNPASRYPRIFLELADRLSDVRLWLLALMAFAYASLRLVEAYGLWHKRRWAEWLAAGSGAIYVPIELYELAGGVTKFKVAALLLNLAIVAYMSWTLWSARAETAALKSAARVARVERSKIGVRAVIGKTGSEL